MDFGCLEDKKGEADLASPLAYLPSSLEPFLANWKGAAKLSTVTPHKLPPVLSKQPLVLGTLGDSPM